MVDNLSVKRLLTFQADVPNGKNQEEPKATVALSAEKKDSDPQQHSIHKMQFPPVRKISTPPPIPQIMIHDPAVAA